MHPYFGKQEIIQIFLNCRNTDKKYRILELGLVR